MNNSASFTRLLLRFLRYPRSLHSVSCLSAYSEPLWDDDKSAALNEDVLRELREMYGAPESSGKDYDEPLW